MAQVQKQVKLSRQKLLEAAEQLSTKELDRFASELAAIRARRNGSQQSTRERRLLEVIHGGFTPAEQARWDELVDKLENETLTPEEHKELLRMTDKSEAFAVKRLKALVKLAKLRKTTLEQLMDELRIRPRHRCDEFDCRPTSESALPSEQVTAANTAAVQRAIHPNRSA